VFVQVIFRFGAPGATRFKVKKRSWSGHWGKVKLEPISKLAKDALRVEFGPNQGASDEDTRSGL
jgi:hypothetical protein